MMDWLAKMLELPHFYLASSGGLGGGVIQVTASEVSLFFWLDLFYFYLKLKLMYC